MPTSEPGQPPAGERKNQPPFTRTVTPDTVVLPRLEWRPTAACGDRHGHPISLIVVHRWGVRYTDQSAEARSYQGVINWFLNPGNQASAHIVYPGSAVPNEATQMVHWADYAWAEAAYNPAAQEIESADAIWLGKDPDGMTQLARIVAYLLHRHGLPPVWSTAKGFCRHADLGAAGGGHTECPTTDMAVWRGFVRQVQAQAKRGGFRSHWGT